MSHELANHELANHELACKSRAYKEHRSRHSPTRQGPRLGPYTIRPVHNPQSRACPQSRASCTSSASQDLQKQYRTWYTTHIRQKLNEILVTQQTYTHTVTHIQTDDKTDTCGRFSVQCNDRFCAMYHNYYTHTIHTIHNVAGLPCAAASRTW